MRIALVHFSYSPIVGGVEIVLAQQAKLFADHGHQVTILCARGASSDSRIRIQLLSDSPAEDLHQQFQTTLAEQDWVFLHNVLTMPFAPLWVPILWELAESLPKVRFYSWIHDLAALNPDYQVSSESLLRKAHPRIPAITVSEERQRQYKNLTGQSSQVIPNGIDPLALLALPGDLGAFIHAHRILQRQLILFQPARLLPRKNIELSLQVLANLRDRSCDAVLLVTAPPDAQNPSSEYANSLRRLKDSLGLQLHAFFLQDHLPLGAPEMAALYQLSDLLFFPSHQEGFGLPLLEAALHRLPIVCPDQAPLNQLLPNSAHLFPVQSPPTLLTDLLLTVLNNSGELHTRKRVLTQFSWEALYEKFLAPLLNSNAS